MVLPPPVRINIGLELMLLSQEPRDAVPCSGSGTSKDMGQGQQGGFGFLDTGTGPSPHWDPPAQRECGISVPAARAAPPPTGSGHGIITESQNGLGWKRP